MPRVDHTRIGSVASTARTSRAKDAPHIAMLKLLGKAVKAAGEKLDDTEVKTEMVNWRSTKLPGKVVAATVHLSGVDHDALGTYASAVHVDIERNRFYVQSWKTMGPIALPAGFKFADLLIDKPDPVARTTYQKALVALSRSHDEQIDKVWTKKHTQMEYDGDTWRKPDGTKLHNVITDDDRFRFGNSKSLMFDLKHKEWWIEQIPGYSGDAFGPFKLPADFRIKDLVKAEKPEKPARPRRADDGYEVSDRDRGHYVGGGGSDAGYSGPRLGDVIGGGGSGPMRPSLAYWSRRSVGGGGS